MEDETAMRERLVGYVLEALEPDERRDLEAALADGRAGAALRRDLELVWLAVAPLSRDRGPVPAPAGLAARTLAFVAAQAPTAARPVGRRLSPAPADSRPRGRAWLDRALVAATALAACILVLPLVRQAVDDARERRRERNLERLSTALQGYAESHGLYPTPPGEGPLSRAGLYAPTLVAEERLVADDGTVLVPGSELARRGGFRVPSLAELEAAVGTPRFEQLVREMGGDYGYTLGHRDAAGVLQPNRNGRRFDHPLVADAPDHSDERSGNDPRGIHHVLFEDGHVARLRTDALHRGDHLYRNHEGRVAAGVDPDDAVIGDSEDAP
ncbi:MAG: hypothetical protein ACKOZU_05345 [Planctomycetaceae bacterium]